MKHIAFLLIAVGMLCMGVLGVSAMDADTNVDGVTIVETDYVGDCDNNDVTPNAKCGATHVVELSAQCGFDDIKLPHVQGLHITADRKGIVDGLVSSMCEYEAMAARVNAQPESEADTCEPGYFMTHWRNTYEGAYVEGVGYMITDVSGYAPEGWELEGVAKSALFDGYSGFRSRHGMILYVETPYVQYRDCN